MKVNFFNDKNIQVFLNKEQIQQLELDSKEELENYFRKIFLKLKEHYHIELYGYYNIILYKDNNYGVVIDIKNEDLEYYEYFDSEIDMRIIINKNNFFLYKVKDIFDIDKKILSKGMFYYYNNEFYFKLNTSINSLELGKLLEQAIIIYKDTNKIINQGRIIHSL